MDAPILGTKSGRGKRLPVPEARRPGFAHTRQTASGPHPLFRNPLARSAEGRWTLDALEHAWNRAAESVGESINLYNETKHTFATTMLQAHGKHVVQALLGHADVRSVDYYAGVEPGTLRNAVLGPRLAPEQTAAEGTQDEGE